MKRLFSLKWRLLPLVMAACVLSIPVIENIWSRHQISDSAKAAQVKLQAPAAAKLEGMPNRILIPSLSIDLKVVRQSYSPAIKSWPVDPGFANYVAETPLINNFKGQSLIYGHNTRAIFGPLLNLKPETVAYVYTDNGHIFKYSYSGSQDVTPAKTEIVSAMANAPPGLNLITCDGPYFQYRHLMAFKLLKAV